MSALFRVLLIALMVLTSQALASARGQSRVAGEMVLCAGGDLVTIRVDAQGQPVEHTVICPDMALGLMAAVAFAAPRPDLSETVLKLPAARPNRTGTGRDAPVAQARDPPRRAA